MEVLDLRTYRDLQYVRDTENLMKTVDGKLKTASENPRSLNPKSFQVLKHIQPKKNGLKQQNTLGVPFLLTTPTLYPPPFHVYFRFLSLLLKYVSD